jgi:enediyne polyketide synthase
MTEPVAVVGLACRYPDANTPAQLWDNVLAQRRAFRQIPPCRLQLDDYDPARIALADSTYLREAALLEGYAFDRLRFRVGAASWRSADLVHWLALEVAADALAAAGLSGQDSAGRATGVLLGNSLTGEFSRASQLRLRWPYVRRTLGDVLQARGMPAAERAALVAQLEAVYKAPFPAPDEETLAGGLSNTIAGRICNHFGFDGGGYTVDAACASSLLAVANACSALVAGDLDLALAGGVDLSLDPFELVGFARTGALAEGAMRVYDARPTGFLPGEGCGMAVLMRLADAHAQGRRVLAVIQGWGVSSDGRGGLTRPEAQGQRLALDRAYTRAGLAIAEVPLFEGHGTGTAVGDAAELAALGGARRDAGAAGLAAALGSVKANIGHTKAASGVAGLIKACLALDAAVLPPTTGCVTPHALLAGADPVLRTLSRAEPWPATARPLASVSAMGFGGINVHVVLAAGAGFRRRALAPHERRLDATAQATELFAIDADDAAQAAARARELAGLAATLSLGELADLAADLAQQVRGRPARLAVVAGHPRELAERLRRAAGLIEAGSTNAGQAVAQAAPEPIFVSVGARPPRIGLLFPGQGSPVRSRGGAWRRRFSAVDRRYREAALPAGDEQDTAVAQPGLVTASLAALDVLDQVGLQAELALGHSLGEIAALAWASAFDTAAALRLARARGLAMRTASGGAMASVALDAAATQTWLDGSAVDIAAFNAAGQTVVSGSVDDIATLLERLRGAGIAATPLAVSQAFHSRQMAAAGPDLRAALDSENIAAPQRPVVSSVSGGLLDADTDVRALLCRQLSAPVRFTEALRVAADTVDLWIEVGTGSIASRLAQANGAAPAWPVEAGDEDFGALLTALAAAWTAGAPLDLPALFTDRAVRPFSYAARQFLANPCEQAATGAPPEPAMAAAPVAQPTAPPVTVEAAGQPAAPPDAARVLARLRQELTARTELPPAAITADSRLLSDLHLNSIVVGQLVVETALALGLPPPASPTDFADARVGDVAAALARLAGETAAPEPFPDGVADWLREFRVTWQAAALPARRAGGDAPPGRWQLVGATAPAAAADRLRAALEASPGGSGVALLVEAGGSVPYAALIEAARLAGTGRERRLLVVHDGAACASFARTLHLEHGGTTVVLDTPLADAQTPARAAAEMAQASSFVEARWRDGRRETPQWQLIDADETTDDAALPGPGEVLLVTGGGRGIAAECALAIAQLRGCALALLGRARRDEDAGLAANLARLEAGGVTLRYYSADVTDAAAVADAVAAVQRELGPVTGLLHGSGVNTPCLATGLDVDAMRRTDAPKAPGLGHVLATLDAGALRLAITFGSIIARTGLAGEADYALANERLAVALETFAAAHPHCRCRNLEWSVWSGVGMGERLESVEALRRQGITPIPPDAGVERCVALCRRRDLPVSVIVAGRFGLPPTVSLAAAPLLLLRFLERVRLHVPGVELVAEADLGSDTDPYLAEHAYAGERLFPAVLGLEALLQAACALDGLPGERRPRLEAVRFDRPVIVPEGRTVTVRMAALRHAPGIVEVALRSAATGFQVDHFRATCRFDADSGMAGVSVQGDGVPLDPATDIYGPLLPHAGRFQRLRAYRHLSAERCAADLASDAGLAWFSRALPAELLLGDPGARDAAIHALQACIPHKTVLPVAIRRIDIVSRAPTPAWQVMAQERSRDAKTLVYDLVIADAAGIAREYWQGLALRVVRDCPTPARWPLALLGPYLQRRSAELLGAGPLHLAVDRGERGQVADRLLAAAVGLPVAVHHRPDGKPLASHGYHVSLAYSGGVALAVAGRRALGCDLERVAERSPATWRGLLGRERWTLAEQLTDERAEARDQAATRVWTALESFKKAGLPADAPVQLDAAGSDGWAVLRSGPFAAATFVTAIRDADAPLTLAVAAEKTPGTET